MDHTEEIATYQAEAQATRQRLSSDMHRPQYHFLPPSNWMNDPNGACQWDGNYHLFYQSNPRAAHWGLIEWGHAVSPDLVHWTDLPVALVPTPDSADADGCWSGCMVNDQGVPTIIYTGVQGEQQRPCLATGDDKLVTWQKYAHNPIIAAPPPGMDLLGFRDHSIWHEGEIWYQVIGSGIKDVGGTALLYRSSDLRNWEYIHPICIGNPKETGEMWECPDLFPLGDRRVLVISPIPLRKSLYLTGSFADHRFTPQLQGVVDCGGHFYAPQTFLDERGRRIMWGWLWEGRDRHAQEEAGWAGVMSLPRILTMLPGGVLDTQPAPELEMLRGTHTRISGIDITPSVSHLLDSIRGDALELKAEFVPGDATAFGLKVRCSTDRAEETLIRYSPAENYLAIDRTRSSLSEHAHRDTYGGMLELAPNEPLVLHIFLDHSVLEIFANGRLCATSRIYPTRRDSLDFDLFSESGTATLCTLDAWQMGSIWS